MDDERRILILDGTSGELQSLAMDLLAQDHSVHYVNDLAEAQLLASEERGRIAVVLLGSEIALAKPAELARRLHVPPIALVPLGPRPSDKVLSGLHREGLRWHLFGKPEKESIRFVLSSVLSENDPLELRFYLRVPARIEGKLAVGPMKGDVRLNDVSLGGACILGVVPGDEGDAGVLDFTIGEADLSLPVRVAWRVDGPGDGVHVAGLAFTEVVPEAGDAIDAFINGVVAPYRIGKRKARA